MSNCEEFSGSMWRRLVQSAICGTVEMVGLGLEGLELGACTLGFFGGGKKMNRLPGGSKDGDFGADGGSGGNADGGTGGGLLAGCVLASSPSTMESELERSVCLIIEQTEEATVGVFLNRPMAVDPKPLWNLLMMDGGKLEATWQGHFNFGGPNNGPILAIHSDSQHAEAGNELGVYLSAQVETLKKLAHGAPEHLRWFIGNATWGKGELEREILDGRWVLVPTAPSIVFAEENRMWSGAMEVYGNALLRGIVGGRALPRDPQSN